MSVQKYKAFTDKGTPFAIRFKPDKKLASRYGVVEFIGASHIWDDVEVIMLRAYQLSSITFMGWPSNSRFSFSHRCTFKEFREGINNIKNSGLKIESVKSFGRLIR